MGVILAIVLGIVIIVGAILFVFASSFSGLSSLITQAQLSELSVGDCFNGGRAAPGPSASVIFGVDQVDCSEPHTSELIATFEYPAPSTDNPEYPGTDRLASFSESTCQERFAAYVGVPFETSVLGMTYVYPTELVWLSEDHSIQCIAHPPDGQETMTGSVRGSGR